MASPAGGGILPGMGIASAWTPDWKELGVLRSRKVARVRHSEREGDWCKPRKGRGRS